MDSKNKKHLKLFIIIASVLLSVILFIIFAWRFFAVLILPFIVTAEDIATDYEPIIGICIGFAVFIVGLSLLIFSVWFIFYLVSRVWLYISLAFISVSKGYQFRVTRLPFASIRGVSGKPDVEISTMRGTLCLHFLDVINPISQRLTIPNDGEYVLTGVFSSGIVSIKSRTRVVYRPTNTASGKERGRPLPAVENGRKQIHILVIPISPTESTIIKHGVPLALGCGEVIGGYTYYPLKYLKKGIKGKLHNSLFESQTKNKTAH